MYIGQRNYSWKSEEIEIGSYREGTATVHIVDAAAKKMLWRGVVQDILPDKEAKLDKTIQEGARYYLHNFL